MIERVITHPTGRFARCRSCNSEPRHICIAGRPNNEPVQFIAVGHRHYLECRCNARTAPHSSLSAAEAQWGSDHAQLALPLRLSRRRKVA